MFIAIIRTEAPVARNKYPEETVEKILDVAERLRAHHDDLKSNTLNRKRQTLET